MIYFKKVFVADVDGVLHRGSLPAKWHKRLVEELGLHDEAYSVYCKTRKLYRQGKTSSRNHSESFVASWNRVISNLDSNIAKKIAVDMISNEGWDNFIFPSNLFRLAKERGFITIALSRCPTFILELYNKIFNFDFLIGNSLVSHQGCYTGEVVDSRIFKDKRKVLIEALDKINKSIDFSKSIGIGDTVNDIEWLDMFESKIAFNPDSPLLLHAKESKDTYTIVHEHKDVVFCPNYSDAFDPIKLAEKYFTLND